MRPQCADRDSPGRPLLLVEGLIPDQEVRPTYEARQRRYRSGNGLESPGYARGEDVKRLRT